VRRYLVVANQTLGGEHLVDTVRSCLAAGPCRFHLVVPASARHDRFIETEGEAIAAAQRRLDTALEVFRSLGANVDGQVGDARPLTAIADVLRHAEFDEIILSTLPPGPSRWLRQDLPHRVERTFGLPLTHVMAEKEPATA
jgi:hypothetical protein